jgi:hypothetical protein
MSQKAIIAIGSRTVGASATTLRIGEPHMQHRKWLVALIALVIGAGAGLIAGCGSSDNNTSSSAGLSGTDTSAGTDTSSSSGTSSGGATADDVKNACLDAIKGTPAEQTAASACQTAADAFQQCADQASAAGGSAGDTALKACQDAADKTVAALNAAP